MRQMDFVEKINTLEQQCLHFELSESDYDDLFSYVIARRRIRHFKAHYYDQPMNYFDLSMSKQDYIAMTNRQEKENETMPTRRSFSVTRR